MHMHALIWNMFASVWTLTQHLNTDFLSNKNPNHFAMDQINQREVFILGIKGEKAFTKLKSKLKFNLILLYLFKLKMICFNWLWYEIIIYFKALN